MVVLGDECDFPLWGRFEIIFKTQRVFFFFYHGFFFFMSAMQLLFITDVPSGFSTQLRNIPFNRLYRRVCVCVYIYIYLYRAEKYAN